MMTSLFRTPSRKLLTRHLHSVVLVLKKLWVALNILLSFMISPWIILLQDLTQCLQEWRKGLAGTPIHQVSECDWARTRAGKRDPVQRDSRVLCPHHNFGMCFTFWHLLFFWSYWYFFASVLPTVNLSKSLLKALDLMPTGSLWQPPSSRSEQMPRTIETK